MNKLLSPPLFALIFILSCSNDVEDRTKQMENAVFSATRVVAYSILPTKLPDWGDFPKGTRLELTTCIRNKGINAPIIDDQFTIHFPDGTSAQRSSNDSGCLYWGLDKNFDFMGREHYSPHTIKIVGTGKHKGTLTIPLAINPWKGTPNAVKDLRFDQIAPRYIGTRGEAAPEASNLHVKNTKISYKKGLFQKPATHSPIYTLSYDVSLWPTYKRIGLDGEPVEAPFNEGRFKVSLALMEKTPSTGRYFNIATAEQTVAVQNGFLNTPVSFPILPKKWPQGSSLLEMFIHLTPIDGPNSLGSFQGVVSMKNLTRNNHDAPGNLATPLNYATLTSQFRPTQWNEQSERDDFIFEIDSIRAEYGALMGEHYNKSSDKTLRAKLRLQLVSPFNEEVIKKTRFLVTVRDHNGNADNAEERMAFIDSKGVLESYALVHYNAYNCSQWFPYTIQIEAIDGQIEGLKKERTIYLNPWNKSNFFYDANRQHPPETDCTMPRIHVSEIEYSNEELDRDNFHLDTYLNLSIRKFYNIHFKPLLKVTTSHQQETPPSPVTYGDFTLRLDLYTPKKEQVDYQNPDLNNFTYITSAEKEVTVEEGVINENMGMPFTIDETVVLSYKNIVAITLTPKNEPYLQPTTRFFPFYAQDVNKRASTLPLPDYHLRPRSQKILEYIRRTGFKIPGGVLNDQLPSSLQLYKTWLFANTTNPQKSFMEIQELDKKLSFLKNRTLSLSDMDRERLLHESHLLAKQTLRKLCPLFYQQTDSERFDDCLENPKQHLKRRPSHHIVDILTTKTIQGRDGHTIEVPVATYAKSHNGSLMFGNRQQDTVGVRSSNAHGDTISHQYQRHFDWGIKSPGFVSAGHGGNYSERDMNFNRTMYSHMATTFNGSYNEIRKNVLTFNSLSLEFEAKAIPCFTVVSRHTPNHQFHICDGQPYYTKMQEQWYFIADLNKKNDQFIADPGKIGDARGPRIIRGRFNFDHFWERIQEKSSRFVHYNDLYPAERDVVKRHLLQIQRYDVGLFNKKHIGYNFFPGMITPVQE